MATPIALAITGTTLSIATNAFKACQQVYNLCKGIRNAPKDIQDLALSIDGLYQVLYSLTTALTNQDTGDTRLPSQMISVLEVVLGTCTKLCIDAKHELDSFIAPDGKSRGGFRNGLKWEFFSKSDVKLLQEALESCKVTISIAILSLTFVTSSQTQNVIEQMCKDIAILRLCANRQEKQEMQGDLQEASGTFARSSNASGRLRIASYCLPLRSYMAETESLIGSSASEPSESGDMNTVNRDSGHEISAPDQKANEIWYSAWPLQHEELLPDGKAYSIDRDLYPGSSVARLPEMFSANESAMEALKKGFLRKTEHLTSIEPSSLGDLTLVGRINTNLKRPGILTELDFFLFLERLLGLRLMSNHDRPDLYQPNDISPSVINAFSGFSYSIMFEIEVDRIGELKREPGIFKKEHVTALSYLRKDEKGYDSMEWYFISKDARKDIMKWKKALEKARDDLKVKKIVASGF